MVSIVNVILHITFIFSLLCFTYCLGFSINIEEKNVVKEDVLINMLFQSKEEGVNYILESNSSLVNRNLWELVVKYQNKPLEAEKGVSLDQKFKIALAIANHLKDKHLLSMTYHKAAKGYMFINEYEKAFEYFNNSSKLAEEIGETRDLVYIWRDLGVAYREGGSQDLARAYSQKSLDLAKTLNDKQGIAFALSNLANINVCESKYQEALDYMEKCLSIMKELGNPIYLVSMYANLGRTHRASGNYLKALQYLNQGLEILKTHDNKSLLAGLYLSLGHLYSELGDQQKMFNYFNDSLRLYRELDDKNKISLLHAIIGDAYSESKEYKRAAEYYQEGFALAEQIKFMNGILAAGKGLGTIYFQNSETERGVAVLNKCIAWSEEKGTSRITVEVLNQLSKLFIEKGDYKKAQEYAERSIPLAENASVPVLLYQALTFRSKALMGQNNYTQAMKSLNQAIDVAEDMRSRLMGVEQWQQAIFENKVEPYALLVKLLVENKEYAKALSIAEMSKGRVLLDVLQRGRINVRKNMTVEEINHESKLEAKISSLNVTIHNENEKRRQNQVRINQLKKELENVRAEHEQFKLKLYARHGDLKIQRGKINPLDISETMELFGDEKTTFLNYVVTESQTYLFVLNRNNAKTELNVYPINIGMKALATQVTDFRNKMANRDLGVRKPGEQLYNILLKPAEKHFKGKENLCVIPDGPLWELPFQALDQGQARWVIEDYAVYYAPSLSVLREIIKKDKTLSKQSVLAGSEKLNKLELLAFGNPKFNAVTKTKIKEVHRGANLQPLPFAEKEVMTLETIYKKQNSKVLIGDEAREGVVKEEASNYRVLHFATHGLLDDRNPMYSRLMLTSEDGTKEDGMLEAWEIMEMNLRADLVVLAACETARGKIGAGEGMIGMSWALFVAGVPATVVSQWKVDSESTSKLMVNFHRNLVTSKEKISKAQSLRQASLKIMKQLDHPYYWAGFVLIGNGR